MILSLIVVLLALWFIYDRLIDGRKLPPGPTRLPFLGNIIQMASKAKKYPAPHILLQEFSKEYGPVITLQYGFRRQIIVDDYDLAYKIFHSDMWLDRPPADKWTMERSFNKPLGILWGNGRTWRNLRRFCIRTLRDFGFGKQKSQEAIMEEELNELYKRMDEKLATSKNSSICMSQIFTISVLNILWSMMAGTRFSHEDQQLQTLVKQIYENTRFHNAAGNILMAYPFLRSILRTLTGVGVARKELNEQMQAQFLALLQERRALGYYKDVQNDFIDVFLMEIDKHKNDPSPSNIYIDQQFSTCALDLFMAGSETTSNTLEFAFLYMILNPKIQEKVQAEIDTEIGSAFPTLIMKNKMPYTDATLLEIQRMSSVAPMTVRAPCKDQKLLDYKIKQGTVTLINISSIHKNPAIWDNSEIFNPERFLNSRNEIVNTKYLFPFGLGKRMCMGDQLARATLFTFFVRFLQNYTIEMDPSYPKPSTAAVAGLTLAPQPYHALIKKRK